MSKEWSLRKVGDLCLVTDYVANGSFAALKDNVQYLDEPDFAMLVRYTDFAKGWNGKHKYVSEAAYRFLSKSSLQAGDLIMANVGEPGRAFLLPDLGMPTTLGPNSILIRPISGETSSDFLHYFFMSHHGIELIDAISSGVAQKKFNKTSFRSLEIPLPSLEEQQRIVAVLDEAFEGLAQARAHAEANLQNARELFNSSLSAALDERGSDWEVVPIGKVFSTSTGNTPPKRQKELYGDAISFVKPPELLNQEIGETADGLSAKGEKVARIAPAGSVLVSCIGILGKVGLAATDVAFNQQINSILPNRSKALPEFMFYQAYSTLFRQKLEALAGGTTVPIVNKSRFNSIEVALPPLGTQQDLVFRFKQIDQQAKQLEEAYHRKLQDLNDLRQSLLQKAFAGELT